MNSVGWVVWSCVLSLVWLLPNHYMPWLSFHADLLCAVVLTFATLPLILDSSRKSDCGILSLLSGLAALVIGIQYAFGQIHQMGTAWIGIAYLLGFIWAIQTGKYWQITRPGLAVDAIFLAIGIASIVSVGLQLQQWFVLDGLFLWTMGGDSLRPHANLGQANQLGTLLLWGLLAGAWGLVRGYIRTHIAILGGAFLLFGIGLTGSRIAWLNVGVLIGAVWFCRNWWGKGKAHWLVTGLGVFFLACVVFQGLIQHWDQGGVAMVGVNENFNRPSGSIRIAAWSAFADAALQQPWVGYGWGQIPLAQMAVSIDHPNLGNVFSYSHNLFLDLILWFGFPLGGLVGCVLLVWFVRSLRGIRNAEDLILMLFLLVVSTHAMVELPLYFGYFLLPVGIVVGMVESRMSQTAIFSVAQKVRRLFWVASVALMLLIARDYFAVEARFRMVQMRWMNFSVAAENNPQKLLLLSQWANYFDFVDATPSSQTAEFARDQVVDVIVLKPNLLLFHKVASVMAWSSRPDEADLWLRRGCKSMQSSSCETLKQMWSRAALQDAKLAAVPWPAGL